MAQAGATLRRRGVSSENKDLTPWSDTSSLAMVMLLIVWPGVTLIMSFSPNSICLMVLITSKGRVMVLMDLHTTLVKLQTLKTSLQMWMEIKQQTKPTLVVLMATLKSCSWEGIEEDWWGIQRLVQSWFQTKHFGNVNEKIYCSLFYCRTVHCIVIFKVKC